MKRKILTKCVIVLGDERATLHPQGGITFEHFAVFNNRPCWCLDDSPSANMQRVADACWVEMRYSEREGGAA